MIQKILHQPTFYHVLGLGGIALMIGSAVRADQGMFVEGVLLAVTYGLLTFLNLRSK